MVPRKHSGISVIILAYNAEETLGEQLEALRAQDYDGEWEVIVVDNHSTDDIADLVGKYQDVMQNLSLVEAS